MKLNFQCPVCSTDLQLANAESTGPCPTCQKTLQVKIQISALELPTTHENLGNPERKVQNWQCSGQPHGTYSSGCRA